MSWSNNAFNAIKTVAFYQDTVHLDDVHAIFKEKPPHHNCWGPVWQAAVHAKVIQPTGLGRVTQIPYKRKRFSRIYASLLRGVVRAA